MQERPSPPPLGEREREILKDVIVTHILSAQPVSSRAVSKRGQHNLSAASIRNIMADLEEQGYLSQPHTSAGRVPTRAGYHLFIDALMDSQALSVRERRYIDAYLRNVPPDAEQLMSATVHLLSELSHQVSVALAPALGETVLKAVEILPLSGNKLLCVVVSSSGFIDNKVVDVEESPSREELIWISNYLTENFAGMTLRQIRDRLLALMAEERAQVDRLMGLSLELARLGLRPNEEPQVLLDGANEVLVHPELSDIFRVRQLFDTFNQKARLVRILNQCMQGEGVRVLIGEDSDVTSELDFSLVTTGYGIGDRRLGSLGIFGPSRMEYQRLVPLVLYLGKAVSRTLESSFSDSEERVK